MLKRPSSSRPCWQLVQLQMKLPTLLFNNNSMLISVSGRSGWRSPPTGLVTQLLLQLMSHLPYKANWNGSPSTRMLAGGTLLEFHHAILLHQRSRASSWRSISRLWGLSCHIPLTTVHGHPSQESISGRSPAQAIQRVIRLPMSMQLSLFRLCRHRSLRRKDYLVIQ